MKKLNKETIKKLVEKAICKEYEFLKNEDDFVKEELGKQKEEVLNLISFEETKDEAVLFSFDGLLYESFNYGVCESLSQGIKDALENAGYEFDMWDSSTLYICKW